MNLSFNYNPFSQGFLKAKNTLDVERERQLNTNSQGVSEEQMRVADVASSINPYGVGTVPGADFTAAPAAFRAVFSSKPNKIATYREMSYFPEIIDALNIISDEAITKDDSGNFVKLKIKADLPEREKKHINKTFEYIVSQVLKIDDRGWKLFRTFLIDSELFLEKILNDDRTKIIGAKLLPAQSTYPVYDSGNVITKFVQHARKNNTDTKDKYFESNQICYLHWDDYGTSLLDVRGYLEPAIRTWNQYKNLQDSLIIYRLVRAPSRRLWNIEVDKLPPGKAEEYLKTVIARYKKNYSYSAETGTVDSSKLFQALTDDYWFIKRGGQGTTVETLESSMNLGELEDVNVFLRSLYKSLQIPKSRWEDTLNSVTANTAPGEITREEVRFSKMVNRFRNRFKKIFIDFLCTQLVLSNQIDKKYTREHIFDIEFCEENVFAEQKKLLNLKSRLDILQAASTFIASKDNPKGLLSREWVMENILHLSDEERQNMNNQIAAEIAEDGEGTGGNTEGNQETPPEETPTKPSQDMNTQNQESNAEDEPETTTPEGSKEQTPSEEGAGEILMP